MTVSIIVPVYNTEKYLKKSIDSILNQTYKDLEVIIINDCSKGNADEIIKSYDDNRITYIKNEKNKGIGYNRNLGIKKAIGDYICFIDSDDYIKEDFVEKMYNKCELEQLDMCICDYNYVHEDGKLVGVELPSFNTTNLDENPKLLIDIPLGPCNKIYKKTMLLKHKIRFSETLKYEDVSFVASTLFYSEKIGKINEKLNFFLVHPNSETTTRDERVFDIFKQLDILKDIYKESKNQYLHELIISILFNYNIQQRYQKYDDIRNKFIDSSFDYLKKNNINYKQSLYLIKRPIHKSFIEKSKFRTKLYCAIYKKLKNQYLYK